MSKKLVRQGVSHVSNSGNVLDLIFKGFPDTSYRKRNGKSTYRSV